MRLIHECMGLPASPPVTSEESEADSDSPPPRSTAILPAPAPQPPPLAVVSPPQAPSIFAMQESIVPQQDTHTFNPQLIRIDERTMQLHFTPLYFGRISSTSRHALVNYPVGVDLLEAMATMKNSNEFSQLVSPGLF